MNNKPNPELIDDENPEWTEVMFSEAKTAAELLPQLSTCNNEVAEGFERGWQEIVRVFPSNSGFNSTQLKKTN